MDAGVPGGQRKDNIMTLVPGNGAEFSSMVARMYA